MSRDMVHRERLPDFEEYFYEQFGELKRSGIHLWAKCPFHKDSSPSLAITPSKNLWKCFGCGESGDIITFHMKMNHMEFVEACKDLGIWGEQTRHYA